MSDQDIANNGMYLDDKEFYSQFIFNPDIKEDADVKHLDKNLAITRLSSKHNEPEIARMLLKKIHILSNPKYFVKEEHDILVGWREDKITENGSVKVMQLPVYQKKTVLRHKYPKAYHNLKFRFYSLTTTAMSRDGHLFRGSRSRFLERSDSIEDRTKNKKKTTLNNTQGGASY